MYNVHECIHPLYTFHMVQQCADIDLHEGLFTFHMVQQCADIHLHEGLVHTGVAGLLLDFLHLFGIHRVKIFHPKPESVYLITGEQKMDSCNTK